MLLQGLGLLQAGATLASLGDCGPSLQGEFVHTLTVTDVFTGWTENMALKNGAHRWVIEAMTVIETRLPFPLVGLDTDNGGEFINHALIKAPAISFSHQSNRLAGG